MAQAISLRIRFIVNLVVQKRTRKRVKLPLSPNVEWSNSWHPDFKEVIPFARSQIIKQDGEKKNDIERNASKRYLEKLRKTHPYLRLIVVEDSLHSNAPHIRGSEKHNMKYIIGAKKGDHSFLVKIQRISKKK